MGTVRLSEYDHSFSFKNKLGRLLWNIVYLLLFRFLRLNSLSVFRNYILRCFGAKVARTANIYASAKIWAPWNLTIGEYSTLGPEVDCYNQGKVCIGDNTVISQKAYICASSHDISDPKNNLILKPIYIGSQVWVAADAFIGPGVEIEDGAVIGARSAVFRKVESWDVVGGNPSKFIKKRIIEEK